MKGFNILRLSALALQGISSCVASTAYTATVHDAAWQPEYVLVATEEEVQIDCQSRLSIVFNGTSPGPALFFKEGETTWVRAYNNMEDRNLTVHWHGLTMRTAPFSDGSTQVSQWPIAPGEYFDYEILPQVGDAGTYWYHSHVEFAASTAHGPLFVKDADEPPYAYDGDIPMIIGEFYKKLDKEIEDDIMGTPFKFPGGPDALIFNGKSGNKEDDEAEDDSCKQAVIEVDPGKTYRLRFVTTCPMAFTQIYIDGHNELEIIEADGRYTKKACTDHIQFGSGERFSALLSTKTEDELDEDDMGGIYTITYSTPNGQDGWLSGTAKLVYNMDNSTTSSKRDWKSSRFHGGSQGFRAGGPRHSTKTTKRGPGDNHPAPAHTQIPGQSQVVLDNNVTEWLEYTLEELNPPYTFPTLDEVTRTLYINVTVDKDDGGKLLYKMNDLSWNDITYQSEPGHIPYLIDAYVNGITPDYEAAQNNNGWDPTTQAFPAEVGEVIDIVWQQTVKDSDKNSDYHPMHAHGDHYWDLGSGPGKYDAEANEENFVNYTPMRRDTTMLYSYKDDDGEITHAWRAWRLRVTEDNVGAWLMHCHILAHMMMGMQTVWVFGDATEILEQIPEPYINGYLEYGGSAYGNDSYDPLVLEYST